MRPDSLYLKYFLFLFVRGKRKTYFSQKMFFGRKLIFLALMNDWRVPLFSLTNVEHKSKLL